MLLPCTKLSSNVVCISTFPVSNCRHCHISINYCQAAEKHHLITRLGKYSLGNEKVFSVINFRAITWQLRKPWHFRAPYTYKRKEVSPWMKKNKCKFFSQKKVLDARKNDHNRFKDMLGYGFSFRLQHMMEEGCISKASSSNCVGDTGHQTSLTEIWRARPK